MPNLRGKTTKKTAKKKHLQCNICLLQRKSKVDRFWTQSSGIMIPKDCNPYTKHIFNIPV